MNYERGCSVPFLRRGTGWIGLPHRATEILQRRGWSIEFEFILVGIFRISVKFSGRRSAIFEKIADVFPKKPGIVVAGTIGCDAMKIKNVKLFSANALQGICQ
jgi:hypothetical protein